MRTDYADLHGRVGSGKLKVESEDALEKVAETGAGVASFTFDFQLSTCD